MTKKQKNLTNQLFLTYNQRFEFPWSLYENPKSCIKTFKTKKEAYEWGSYNGFNVEPAPSDYIPYNN